jgi:hypothetical protein
LDTLCYNSLTSHLGEGFHYELVLLDLSSYYVPLVLTALSELVAIHTLYGFVLAYKDFRLRTELSQVPGKGNLFSFAFLFYVLLHAVEA